MNDDNKNLKKQLENSQWYADELEADNKRLQQRIDAMTKERDWLQKDLQNTKDLLEKYKAAYFDILLEF